MDDKDSWEKLMFARRVVIKVGTSTLTRSTGRLNLRRLNALAVAISDLMNQGVEVILVSSGAVAVGCERLGLSERPGDIIGRQAASSVGQACLMQIYEKFFAEYNHKVAQLLLTKDVIDSYSRRANVENTLFRLLSLGVLPVINENDAVSTDELSFTFSENDTLSAYVALISRAGLLIILSDVDGLYDSDPKKNPDAKVIPLVMRVDAEIEKYAGGPGDGFGSGGMLSKLSAVKLAADAGIDVVIASGENPAVIFDIMEGKPVGTLFAASKARTE
ncbi:MAG: glutamate 5-kinase [Clostridiales bacterium]|jgi:glutamate 5-kinase|nr:glutamate 5-kinase [Clostridiales bacterium]